MRKLFARFGIALITFLVGVGIASICSHHEPIKSVRFLTGPACTNGIVSVEPQSQVPLRISISDTACENSKAPSVQFAVKNIHSKPIIKYEIRTIVRYERLVNIGSGVLIEFRENLQPHQNQTVFILGGVEKGPRVRARGELEGFQLTVWSVDFADGTKWTRPSPN